MNQYRFTYLWILVCAFFVVGDSPSRAQAEFPEEALEIKEEYKGEVADAIEPSHQKYIQALVRMKSDLTREGNLDAAVSVSQELEAAREWEGLPMPNAEEPKKEIPEALKNLRASYAKEIVRVLGPVQAEYVQDLTNLQSEYTRDSKLEDAIQVRNEIERAKNWSSVPLPGGVSNYSKREFEDWLQEREFFFQGVSPVTLRFKDGEVEWKTPTGEREHPYEIHSGFKVIVNGAQDFVIQFSDRLESASFSSNVGTYNLEIKELSK